MKKKQNGAVPLGGWILRFVQGLIIGVGGILPGVSGGVLCVVFGLYRPVMEVCAAPFKNLKKYLGLLLPVALAAHRAGEARVARLRACVFHEFCPVFHALFVPRAR